MPLGRDGCRRTISSLPASATYSPWLEALPAGRRIATPGASATLSASLGDLRPVARARVFHGLRLCRREGFAHLSGAARGIQRRLRVALKLRHHLAGDQFVAPV